MPDEKGGPAIYILGCEDGSGWYWLDRGGACEWLELGGSEFPRYCDCGGG